MSARIQFLVGYIGSAALVAFLATCLAAPRVATFTCDTPPGESRERCEFAQTLPAAPADSRDAAGVDRVALHDPGAIDSLD